MDSDSCQNCASLSLQCKQLKEEISILNQKFDNLLNIVSKNKKDFCCQVDPLLTLTTSSTQTETEIKLPIIPNINSESSIPEVLVDSSLSTSYQEDILLDIFNKYDSTNEIPPVLPQENSYVAPFVVLPYVNIPNSPFSDFDITAIDEEIVFDKFLNNRSLCYFGECSYSYNQIKHEAKPISTIGTYLSSILAHIHQLLPDFQYNSILVSKYCNGSDYIGFHSDNEPEILEQSDIVTISFGETRVAKFRGLPAAGNFNNEQSLRLNHGDVFIMSRASQNYFEHSIIADNTSNPRISITLRSLKSKSDLTQISPSPSLAPTIENMVSVPDQLTGIAPCDNAPTKDLTVYISDSMFRGIESTKMSSQSQEAIVLTYPGATAGSILSRLKSDPKFQSIDSSKVTKCYLLCAGNNVDNILNISRDMHNYVISNNYSISYTSLQSAKRELTELAEFIHTWAANTSVNILNILPRQSFMRNKVINQLNIHIQQLSHSKSYISLVATEIHRKLFSFNNGHRKSNFFSPNGSDNIHLNQVGIVRLGKYLKFFAHNDYIE